MEFMKGFKPSYYDAFYCFGKNCKSTCCQKWRIVIFEKEVEEWKNKTPELFELFYKFLKKNEKNNDYTLILDEKGYCPFLSEEGLCSIQQKYGYEVLSKICKIYPRKYMKHGDMVEMHLSPSCEAVVKQLIKEKEGIKLINYKIKNTRFESFYEKKKIERPIFQYCYDIKVLLLSILQDREYTIEERILLLGLAVKKLDEMEKNNRIVEIPVFVDIFLENMEKQNISEKLKSFKSNEVIQMLHNVVNINISVMKETSGQSDLAEAVEKIKERITPRDEEEQSLFESPQMVYRDLVSNKNFQFQEKEYSLKKYKEAIEEYGEFIKGKEYYIENYMVAWVLHEDILFSNEIEHIWDEYCYFAILYSMYRFMLVCCLHKNFNDDEFINYTVAFSRSILNRDKNYMKERIKLLKKNEKDNLDYIATMIL